MYYHISHNLLFITYITYIIKYFYLNFQMDHEKRLRIIGNVKNELYQKSKHPFYIKSPTEKESYTTVIYLKLYLIT